VNTTEHDDGRKLKRPAFTHHIADFSRRSIHICATLLSFLPSTRACGNISAAGASLRPKYSTWLHFEIAK
jgi:hypothetical protein